MPFAFKLCDVFSNTHKSDKNYMRIEIVSFMTQFNFIMFSSLLGIVCFQKLNSGGFYIGFDYFPLKNVRSA